MSTRTETGAPANLGRLEKEELEAFDRIAELRARCEALQSLVQPNDESENAKSLRQQVASLQVQLGDAYDLWLKLSRQLREFDRSVKMERREGEKILVADAKEIIAQFILSINVALESYIISIAQNSYQCNSAEEFYQMHAENLRAARDTAIESAKRDGVLPEWVSI